ncbi:hypothetical protein DFH06DRAFT_252274 [Mycena polygramma]|nr:hypothetical protein DFH06DRAFT_252274 [Mycena polygramma]
MFIIGPIVEITALFFAAYTIRRRAIIKHGRDELPVLPQPPQPPQPPVYRPAWETAPVAELNLPLSLEKLESHVSGLSVRTIYWLAFALLIIAGLCSGVAALLKPFPHDDDDDGDGDGDKNTRGMTYLEFCRLSFFYLAVSAFWWLSLICMSRQKASKDERAGDHVGYATYNGLGRLFYFFVFICLRRRSETFSKVISFCTSHAFRQLECVPLGTFVVIPFVDSFIFFSVAVIVCRRAVALYGTARVLVEPEPTPDPKPIPAWKMGKVIDLDLPVAAKNETEEADEALELDPLVPSSVDSASPSP